MTTLGYFKSIIMYQMTLDSGIPKTSELLDSIQRRYFNPEFYENANIFFNHVLKTVSFKDISKNEMSLYLEKIQNINTTIDSFFYTKPTIFLEEEIQTFYVTSSLLYNKVSNVIQNLVVENTSINNVENQNLIDLQYQYREYLKKSFFRKYIDNVIFPNGGSNTITLSSSKESFVPRKEYIKWDVEILYNQKKRPHFEYVFRQFYTPHFPKKEKRLGILYFMKNVQHLPKIENYQWSHNMIVKEYDAKYDYVLNKKDHLYNIRYDINNVKENDVKRIFIYGYSMCNGVKFFVGFAYYNTEHFRQVSPPYLSIFSVW